MIFKDLIKIYETKKKIYGVLAHRHISDILQEAKDQYAIDLIGGDYERSWCFFKGQNLKKLIECVIKDAAQNLGLRIADGDILKKSLCENLPYELNLVKRNLIVDYGEFGYHFPDVDIVIYAPKTSKVIAVILSGVASRKRITQVRYWRFKFASEIITKHIKVYFVTPDEIPTTKHHITKAQFLMEKNTDGSYILSETHIEESNNIKMFDKFIDDLKTLPITA